MMTYTSGTTGMPKGAMLSYRNALYKTAVGQEMFRSDDAMLAVAPLYAGQRHREGAAPAAEGACVAFRTPSHVDRDTARSARRRYRVDRPGWFGAMCHRHDAPKWKPAPIELREQQHPLHGAVRSASLEFKAIRLGARPEPRSPQEGGSRVFFNGRPG